MSILSIFNFSSFFRKSINVFTGTAMVAWLIWVHHPSHPYRQNQIKYQTHVKNMLRADNVKHVILADSHGERLSLGNLSDHTFNLANGGDSTKEMLAKLKTAVSKHSDTIEHVLLSVDPHMFSTRRIESSKSQFLFPVLPISILKETYHKSYFEIVCIKLSPLLDSNYYAYERERMRRFLHGELEKNDDKHVIKWQNANFEQRTQMSKAVGKNDLRRLFKSKQAFKHYRSIDQLCEHHQIKVYPVIFPGHIGYYDVLDEGVFTRILDFLQELSTEPLIVAPKDLFDSSDFYDPDHLSEQGVFKLLAYLRQKTGVSW